MLNLKRASESRGVGFCGFEAFVFQIVLGSELLSMDVMLMGHDGT